MANAHACNEPMRCPECIRRFYQWAQSHTYGRRARTAPPGEPNFYEAAAKFRDVDNRSRR